MREIAPPSHRMWLKEKEDEYADLEARYAEWISNLSRAERLFTENVYTTQDLNDDDLRQHRFWLFHLSAFGEYLALDFIHADTKENKDSYVRLIDEKLAALRKTLIEWHTPADYQDEVPDSFKRSLKEASEGKLLEFPDAEAKA